jgi:hypothetical protein
MTATSPTLPAGGVDYVQSEEEAVTGKRKDKGAPEMLPDPELQQLLKEYMAEAKESRESGVDARDPNWIANHNAYWGRTESTGKAEWQAEENMPEFANFIDRHTAALRMALMSQPNWFDITDPTDPSHERDKMMRRFVQIHLDHCTTNKSGQRIGFDSTFGNAVKSGALTVLAASVTYDPISGFVNIDPVNPFELYYDPKGRGLYRIRRTEVDRWQLEKMKSAEDSKGGKLYHGAAIDRLQSHIDAEAQKDREVITGGSEVGTGNKRRKPVQLDEYLCTIIDRDGKMIAENQLIVYANQREIIRGPEDNPNWHGKDWIVMTPTIEVPFSTWGRSYGELFRALSATFTEVTNLILDGTFAANIGAHMVWTDALANPAEITDGIYPGLTVQADAEWPPGKDFIKKIEMGGAGPEAMALWSALKSELREGASANELSLGQVPPKGDITAREIEGSERGSTTLAMNTAKDIDTRFLAPIIELTLMTALQHFDPKNNPTLADELNPNMTKMIAGHRREFADKKYKFVAKGLTAAMDRGQRLQGMLGFLQIIGQSEILAAAFAKDNSISKLVQQLLINFDIDKETLAKTDQEKQQDAQAEADRRIAEGRDATGLPPGGPGGPTGAGSRGGGPQPRIPKG